MRERARETGAAALEAAVARFIRGKPEAVELASACLLAGGHLLIEDVPGVGKTTLAQALARAVDGTFQRVQCTADMLPSDILGVTIFDAASREFEFKRGPIFANVLLADEINRATPKTQSALLEAMNEAQVTVDGRTYPLEKPFMVIATQNPAEHHGTYPLPESQLDRFLMRIEIGYPGVESEREIVRQTERETVRDTGPVLSKEEALALSGEVSRVMVADALVDYMLAIVAATRSHEGLTLGVSPRGSQALYRAAQAIAFLSGRDYATPDDVKRVAIPVCAHRVMVNSRTSLNQRGVSAAGRVIASILTTVEVPL
ncbi:MAG: MoxR family ATPase [Bryobacteraceae bacterium]|nr:MoxR family ATPase [Bryobacteraceae bacterium]